ncbi:hypothetical protein TNCV_58691 [Trichonephila clavipes]|nr:hypothetical protein TNCV_58691 [Trichonephila clavipes]
MPGGYMAVEVDGLLSRGSYFNFLLPPKVRHNGAVSQSTPLGVTSSRSGILRPVALRRSLGPAFKVKFCAPSGILLGVSQNLGPLESCTPP